MVAHASESDFRGIAAELFHIVSQPFDGSTRVEQPKVLRLPCFCNLSGVGERPQRQPVAKVCEDDALENYVSRDGAKLALVRTFAAR